MRLFFSVIAGLAASIAIPAQAQQDDRFTLRLGAMNVDAQGELSGVTGFAGEDFSFSEDFDFGSKEVVPRVDGVFRFGQRNRLIFDYFQYDKDQRATLGSDLSYDGVTIPAGSFAKGKVKFQLASLMYDFAVVDTPTFNLGLQIGAEWAKLEGRVYAEAGDDRYQARSSDDGYAPVVGVRLTATPNERWLFNLQGQYLDADWGDFGDYQGDITRANAIAEYRFTPRFGAFVGYDWFKLDVERSGSDGLLGLDQRFKGPVAGITLAF
ncbi:hypothetical protein [Pseudoxanthomonas wuyuanensis]|uniref:Outer membrane protein beta-barrel domain-containing protein n=1 Tax=Pseudoxanthomonas wuyuanensis TaxID=1073196 RepID=A0A286DB17_9GAMM|nr:hypothetical protein [Pseudoxanthomonas wuyuanensis]KAF1721799.1 hypothetical protein CSC75_06245 [Pseudoxanthomonas wuyuanensis]SOD55851.1 hypothetical protein SAMN06296416_10847 [Pseudoxanthomonas wuyuanensis]